MPRDGAVVLSDLGNPTLSIVCETCGRRGTYNVARLMERHGDAKLTDLIARRRARSASTIGARRCSKGWPYSSLQPLRRERRESAGGMTRTD
jgi:hypothetical protein